MLNEIMLGGFKLSPHQRNLWLAQQSGAVYRAQCGLRIEGRLDVGALRNALESLVARHEIFRTIFQRPAGVKVPVQIVTEGGAIAWQHFDLKTITAPQSRVEELLEADWNHPFDYEQYPLLRLTLITLSERKQLLNITLPALCADARTLRNFFTELVRLYAANSAGGVELSGEPLQYADFAAWQLDLLESADAAEGKSYWERQLAVIPPAPRLPFGSKSASTAQFTPRVHTRVVAPELCVRLNALTRKYEATLEEVLLACWQTLLWRFAGQPESFTVGVVCDGRPYDELQDAMGLYAKLLPLQCHISRRLTCGDVIRRVQCTLDEMRQWQEYFTSTSVVSPDGNASSPTDIHFAFAEHPTEEHVAGVAWSVLRQRVYSDRFVVKLSCVREKEGLLAEIHYDASTLDEENARQLAECFEALLASVADDSELTVGEWEILGAAERQRLLVEFNRTQTVYHAEQSLHGLFERQVDEQPHSVAATFREETLTFAELDERANQLAHHLLRLGVGADVPVGLCLERTPEMLVGVLGILKAGGAYVPLDQTHPKERLAFMLADARVPVLLTSSSLRERLPEHGARVVCLDAEWETISRESSGRPDHNVHPQNLAYIIYTSGSTGKPKGVMVSHGGLVNYLSWCVKAYEVAKGGGAPVHSPLGFDLTITSLFAPLLAGRRVTLLSEEAGIEALAAELSGAGDYSLVKLTPSHLDTLNMMLSPETAGRGTRALIIGGEALKTASLLFWQTHAPRTRIFNEYGPTETVVGCCVYEATAGALQPGAVPIGRPIANTQLYILDVDANPVPTGVPGELYIGGAGVARGYLNHPELTAEKFVPHPFSDEPGGRLYKTGDLTRHLPSGQIEFLGRLDQQVKIRGHRIELEEIEVVLSEHEGVRECAVVIREEQEGNARLVGYVVAADATREDLLEELRNYLRERLPEYMIPAPLVLLAELPLTQNGKVDRQALPNPHDVWRRAETMYVAPRNATEVVVAAIWAEVLGVERVGVTDNFFELGGHSLLAVQVLSRLRNLFHIELPVALLFEVPTVAQLVEAMSLREPTPGQTEKIANLLGEIESMSGAEVEQLLQRHAAGQD
jgi:amino acid adenylation domain-containing protein